MRMIVSGSLLAAALFASPAPAAAENPFAVASAVQTDNKASWRYDWPVPGEPVPTLFYSDYFRLKSQLSVGDEITVVGQFEIVSVTVIRIDPVGPIVLETARLPRF